MRIDKNAILGRDRKYGIDVDVKKLSKLIDYELRTTTRDFAIIGHLAPYVLKRSRIDFVVVLRRSPYQLMKTFEQRKYSLEKIRENVASEILGVSLYDALKTFGKDKIVELDTTGEDSGVYCWQNNVSNTTGRKRENRNSRLAFVSL